MNKPVLPHLSEVPAMMNDAMDKYDREVFEYEHAKPVYPAPVEVPALVSKVLTSYTTELKSYYQSEDDYVASKHH